ncbi:MAG: adenine nucleotide alpha hydrolase family protein [Frankiales bacterium]|nr:adenine nucleotide alpha hydrolase family protein [Frankiales bacterium]
MHADVKCKRCGEPPVIEVRRHRAAFCADCFLHHCREQVRRVLEKFHMVEPGERVLVAISGGKDSLALWDILLDLGYVADGVYLGLGITDYSDTSLGFAQRYADGRGAKLHVVDIPAEHGFGVPDAAKATKRVPCSACGLSKRHLLNRAAIDGGYDVLATGHNLDDEAAVLFGNVMQWHVDYLARQRPVLPATPGFARRVKPLIRLSERETAAYCVIRRIDYIVEECPMAAGNKHLRYKETLNAIEERTPGAKATFYLQFLNQMQPVLAGVADEERASVGECTRCGSPSTSEICAFCKLVERAATDSLDGR